MLFPTWTIAQKHRNIYTVYDKTKSPHDNYKSGFANIFVVYGDSFRVRLIDTSIMSENPMVLEKLYKKWTVLDSFNFSPYFSFSVCNPDSSMDSLDYNFDNHYDFVIEERWYNLIFLYDKVKRQFVRSGYYSDRPEKVIGKSNLFFDEWGFKFDNSWSIIYTIKNFERINLGIAEIKVKRSKKDDGTFIPQYISIRQFANNNEKEILRFPQKRIAEFSFKQFWNKYYNLFYNAKSNQVTTQKYDDPSMYVPIDE